MCASVCVCYQGKKAASFSFKKDPAITNRLNGGLKGFLFSPISYTICQLALQTDISNESQTTRRCLPQMAGGIKFKLHILCLCSCKGLCDVHFFILISMSLCVENLLKLLLKVFFLKYHSMKYFSKYFFLK